MDSTVVSLIMWQVKQDFHNNGFMTDVDLDPGCTLNKKIRNAQLAQYNFILGQWQHTLFHSSLCFLSLSLSLSHCPSRYWFFFFFPLCMFPCLEKWWERRRRRVTLWMYAPEITKSMASALWRSASSVWNNSRPAGVEMLKRTSELSQTRYQLVLLSTVPRFLKL